jgi:regulatory protein YycI of two-component signal transduction system YycFG
MSLLQTDYIFLFAFLVLQLYLKADYISKDL